jgi:hypothetical protein
MEAEARLMLEDDQTTALVIEHKVKRGLRSATNNGYRKFLKLAENFPAISEERFFRLRAPSSRTS